MTKLSNIKYSIHPLFVVILMLSIFTGHFIELIVLFMFVLAHEFGHLIMARQFNWDIKELKLLPFGGVLIVDDAMATNAKEELLVACSGPLQNAVLIVFISLCGQLGWISYDWVDFMVEANIWLIIFNLLPISPLDGGKIVQAILSMFLSYFYTIKAIVWISIVGAAAMILLAIFNSFLFNTAGPQLNLLLIGSFLFADNLTKLKHLPYILYRFILQREKMMERINTTSTEAIPIVVSETDSLFSLFKKIKREAHHLFYCVHSTSKHIKVKTEHEIIEKFIQSSHLNRALRDIFD